MLVHGVKLYVHYTHGIHCWINLKIFVVNRTSLLITCEWPTQAVPWNTAVRLVQADRQTVASGSTLSELRKQSSTLRLLGKLPGKFLPKKLRFWRLLCSTRLRDDDDDNDVSYMSLWRSNQTTASVVYVGYQVLFVQNVLTNRCVCVCVTQSSIMMPWRRYTWRAQSYRLCVCATLTRECNLTRVELRLM